MHPSLAFVNGTGRGVREELRLLNALLSSATTNPARTPAKDNRKDEPDAKPDDFNNDPDDPNNPNEVREDYLKKLKR